MIYLTYLNKSYSELIFGGWSLTMVVSILQHIIVYQVDKLSISALPDD